MNGRTIYKYTPDVSGLYEVPTADARVVHVAQQYPDDVWPTLWVEVDVPMAEGTTVFDIFGTGNPISEDFTHVGSAVCGEFVWHVYRAP